MSPALLLVGCHCSDLELLARLISKSGFGLVSPDDQSSASESAWIDQGFVKLISEIILNQNSFLSDAILLGMDPHNLPDQDQVPESLKSSAADYLIARSSLPGLSGWGVCDQRASFLLDFFSGLNDGLRVVAIYSDPWLVSIRLKRRYPDYLLSEPSNILKIWQAYNQELLDYKKRNPERCLLLHSSSLHDINCLHKVLDWIGAPTTHELVESSQEDASADIDSIASNSDVYSAFYHRVYPDVFAIYNRLEESANLPSRLVDSAPKSTNVLRLNSEQAEPDISVIVPTYNQGDLLVDCIASVEYACAAVPERKVELIVVNDGSTDSHSVDVINVLSSLGYRIMTTENQGLSSARNIGISVSAAAFIIPLDDDNLLLPSYLSVGYQLISDSPQCAVVYGDRIDFGLHSGVSSPGPTSFLQMIQMNHVDACALIRRSWFGMCGGYDASLQALEDWDLWLRFLSYGATFSYIQNPCFCYCHRPSSMIRNLLASPDGYTKTADQIRSKYV
jgi:hypothetical protein